MHPVERRCEVHQSGGVERGHRGSTAIGAIEQAARCVADGPEYSHRGGDGMRGGIIERDLDGRRIVVYAVHRVSCFCTGASVAQIVAPVLIFSPLPDF